MTEVNRNNYEVFFMDYLDGNLSSSQEVILQSFLEKNPELKKELKNFEQLTIPDESIHFEEKKLLKKSTYVNDRLQSNFDELCIAYTEGDLTNKEKLLFEASIKDSVEKKSTLKKYQHTKLKADTSVIFPEKKTLKKSGLVFSLKKFYPSIALAASVLILIALYFFIPKTPDNLYQDKIMLSNTQPEAGVKKETEVQVVASHSITQNESRAEQTKKIVSTKKTRQETKITPRINDTIHSITRLPVRPIKENQTALQLADVNTLISNQTLNYFQQEYAQEADYMNLKSFLSESFNERVLKNNTPKKNNSVWFNIAQWSLHGINRITGSNITLEKEYNQDGEAEKINFHTKFIAFSTPVKEK